MVKQPQFDLYVKLIKARCPCSVFFFFSLGRKAMEGCWGALQPSASSKKKVCFCDNTLTAYHPYHVWLVAWKGGTPTSKFFNTQKRRTAQKKKMLGTALFSLGKPHAVPPHRKRAGKKSFIWIPALINCYSMYVVHNTTWVCDEIKHAVCTVLNGWPSFIRLITRARIMYVLFILCPLNMWVHG